MTNWNRAIKAVTDLKESNESLSQQIRENLETGGNMSMIQAVLQQNDFRSNNILTNTPMPLAPLVKNIIDRHLPKAKTKQINLTLSEGRLRGVLVRISLFFLQKMIAVLIDNAIIHGRKGCDVVIDWQKTGDNFIRFEVAGTGRIITEEQKNSIWKPCPHKDMADTTVHGLYIIRKAAEAWGGSAGNSAEECAHFENDFQEHTFWFTFPFKPRGEIS